MNKSRIPEPTGDVSIRSIKLVLRKNKFNECRLSPMMKNPSAPRDLSSPLRTSDRAEAKRRRHMKSVRLDAEILAA